MKVHLRKKQISNQRYSIYLEYYSKGKRSFEFLELYISSKSNLTTSERNSNKNIMKTAEKIKSIREYEIIVGKYTENKQHNNTLFVEYMELLVTERGNYHKYVPRQLLEYLQKDVIIGEVDVAMLEGFRKFLLKKYMSKTDQQYMTTINITLNEALRQELVPKNPLRMLKPLRVLESKREHLAYVELQSLYNTGVYPNKLTVI